MDDKLQGPVAGPNPKRPTLLGAMLFGSMQCLVIGVISPAAVAFALALRIAGDMRAEAVRLIPLLVLIAGGSLFLIHEVILVSLTLFLRNRFGRMTAESVKSVYFQSIVCTDLVLLAALGVYFGMKDAGALIWVALLMAAAIYGATLFTRSVLRAVVVLPPSPDDIL
jgi:hypothetical protein